MPIEPTPIPPFPTPPPTADDPTNFPARGDATVEWFVDGVPGIEQAAEDTYANALEVFEAATDLAATAAVASASTELVGFSNSTLAMTPGSKSIVLTAPKTGFKTNGRIAMILRSDSSIRMFGSITGTPTSTTMTATVVTNGIFGSGTYADWIIMDAAFLSAAATALDMWAGVTDAAGVAPLSLKLASEFQALTDATTIAWNTNTQGFNSKVTLGGNRTMGAPTNLKDGWTYSLNVKQDATGSRTLSWDSIWDFGAAGTPVLSTGANKIDKVVGQYDAAANKIQASFRRAA